MREITHRQMRNESGEVLRLVAEGETMVITNNGVPAATIGPPPNDPLANLAALGQVRRALEPAETLRAITPKPASGTTTEIIADSRGRW